MTMMIRHPLTIRTPWTGLLYTRRHHHPAPIPASPTANDYPIGTMIVHGYVRNAFFAPEEPTGLENLFANTVRLVDDDQAGRRAHASAQSKGSERLSRLAKRWAWLAALCMIPLGGVMFKVWERNKGSRVFAG